MMNKPDAVNIPSARCSFCSVIFSPEEVFQSPFDESVYVCNTCSVKARIAIIDQQRELTRQAELPNESKWWDSDTPEGESGYGVCRRCA